MIRIATVMALLLIIALAWLNLRRDMPVQQSSTPVLLAQVSAEDDRELTRPIPLSLPLDPQKVALGERLFHDPRLSGKGFSCNTCHNLEAGGMDGRAHTITVEGGEDVMNTPTVFNVGFYPYLQWRADQLDLSAQLDAVLANRLHMGNSWAQVEKALSEDAEYRRAFERIYGTHPLAQNIRDALVTFEQSLITPDSAFDRWLRGDEEAMSEQQQKGYRLFKQYGCSSCHQGINLGGNLIARYGVFGSPYHHRKQSLTDFDEGRSNVTGKREDRFLFRVPGLRNVAVTAPYFHDGSISSLDEAIRHMGHAQLGVDIPDDDRSAIAAFLKALTGEYRGRRL